MTKPIESGDLIGAKPLDTRTKAADLVLVRHGRPALSRKQRIGWRAYISWWAAYGESGLAAGERPPPDLLHLVSGADLILASPLPRARETAAALCNGQDVATDPLFVEAPLPSPPLPIVRLKPGTWGVLSRILWWLGYSAKGESRRHAEMRAVEAADKLVQLAQERSLVVLCAHGWFNRMIRKVLRARGWRETHDGGDGYWAHRHFKAP